jgi:hypothetical protein
MRRTFTVFTLPMLAVLGLLAPWKAVAGPPKGASGKMVLASDEVSELLLAYRRETDPRRCLALLTDLAETRDPRVAVALGQALYDRSDHLCFQAAFGILFHQSGEKVEKMMPAPATLAWARDWWDAHKADLRRRAAKLPR